MSQEWLKLQLSNFAHRVIISSLDKGITNHPQKGRGYVHVTYFACATVDLERFCHGTLLSDINNAVDDGPMFLTPWTVDAIQGLRRELHMFDLSLYLLSYFVHRVII